MAQVADDDLDMAREEFQNEETDRWQEFITSDVILEMWNEAEQEAWEEFLENWRENSE